MTRRSNSYQRMKLRAAPDDDTDAIIRRLVRYRGFPADLLEADWGEIPREASHRRPIAEYLDDYPALDRQGVGLILAGGYSSGKTMAASLIAAEAVAWGTTALFVRAHELAVGLAHPGKRKCPSGEDLEIACEAVPLLVLDDYGAEDHAPWIARGIEDVIRSRINSRSPTLITTNIAPAALPAWLRSLADRGKFQLVEVTDTKWGVQT